jgi:hypothetical protein
VPGFMNRHSTPCAMSARTYASADSAGRESGAEAPFSLVGCDFVANLTFDL